MAKTIEINLVLIMNDYFSTKNNGSLKSNRKLLTVKHLQSNTRDNLVQVSVSKPHNVVVVKIAS